MGSPRRLDNMAHNKGPPPRTTGFKFTTSFCTPERIRVDISRSPLIQVQLPHSAFIPSFTSSRGMANVAISVASRAAKQHATPSRSVPVVLALCPSGGSRVGEQVVEVCSNLVESCVTGLAPHGSGGLPFGAHFLNHKKT
ncbi:hypothetical protein Tco_0183862 [Tanacetum coccineum]